MYNFKFNGSSTRTEHVYYKHKRDKVTHVVINVVSTMFVRETSTTYAKCIIFVIEQLPECIDSNPPTNLFHKLRLESTMRATFSSTEKRIEIFNIYFGNPLYFKCFNYCIISKVGGNVYFVVQCNTSLTYGQVQYCNEHE